VINDRSGIGATHKTATETQLQEAPR
jgi:hypothetical protein